MHYPSVLEIRKRLEMLKVPDSFVAAAYEVCDEADASPPVLYGRTDSPMRDLQLIAKLQFIERVLNG